MYQALSPLFGRGLGTRLGDDVMDHTHTCISSVCLAAWNRANLPANPGKVLKGFVDCEVNDTDTSSGLESGCCVMMFTSRERELGKRQEGRYSVAQQSSPSSPPIIGPTVTCVVGKR